MKKFTLIIASLFLAVGAMAQTFVMPETGKYYKIKGDHSSLCWLTSEIDQSSKAIKVSSNENDAAVFERTSNGFRVVSTGKYLGMNGTVISYVGAEAAVTVHNTGSQYHANGKYAIKVVNNWLYNNSTEANPVTHESEGWISNIERFWGFIEVYTNNVAKTQLGSLINQVTQYYENGIIGNAVGQYSSSNEDFAHDFLQIQSYYNGITTDTEVAEIETKTTELQNLIATFSPNMPVNGKAYTFKNVQKNGTTVCWFKYDNGSIGLTTKKDEATAFICRKLDNGEYAFVMNAGKYMIWKGSNGGYNSNNGVSDSYDNTDVRMADFTIEKMTTGNNISGDLSYTTRYVQVKGRRATGNDRINYYVIKRNNGNPIFDQANAPFYNDNFSSAFIMDEVDYANAPILNSVGESKLLTSDLHNKVMATFSAPFPTVVPAGVKAYYATDNGYYVTLNSIEDGKAIPANTGVVLVGDYEESVTVTMAPAAGETVAEVSGNALSHSAGAAKEISGGYILTAKDGVAGFYKANAGTLAMNKAYINISSAQDAVEIRLPGTTSIENVEVESADVIYDLTGRQVNAVERGIYIINGKKVLVK